MIVYGSRGKHLHSEETNPIHCSHCQGQRKHTISVYGRYAHIFWIPFFPLGKKGVSECNHCKITLAPKEMNEQLKLAFQNAKKNTKTPIWFWSLLLIIVLLFGTSIVQTMILVMSK